jgi:antitoxin component of MazEF toxin-antitoxin module
LAVRIPKPVRLAAKLETRDELEVQADGPGRVRIRKAKLKPALEQLVSRITAESQHAETGSGEPAGKELC